MGFEILCCFYSEFNTEKGAEIIYQFPKDYIKQEDFLKISEIVIPRTELCDNLVSLKLGSAYLMGFPIHLKNTIYERTKFQFNFCLLISEEEYEKNYLIYELLLKKVAKTLEVIEIDAEYGFIKKNRNIIFDFFEKLYKSLKAKEDVISIYLDLKHSMSLENFYFFFKFIDFSKAKVEILPHQVPVWLKYIDEKDMMYFENSVKIIIQQIDGISYVKKIASKLDLELSYVIYILYNLYLTDCIALVDIFQFANIYRATSTLKNFYSCPKNFSFDFKKFCDINLNLFDNRLKHLNEMEVYLQSENNNLIDEEQSLKYNNLTDNVLFSLYCELTNSSDVSEFLYKIKEYKINISLFIAFGIYKKIIRRVHIYGYCKNKDNKENIEQGSTE